MRKLLASILILFTLHSKATDTNYYVDNKADTNYYVDNEAGSDGNTGLVGHPWATIDKVNAKWLAGTFGPGDSILFQRDETFTTTTGIIVKESGGLGKPIVLGAYGTGAKPIITGFKTLTFTSHVGNIYTSNETISVDPLNLVTLNGKPIGMGRYPQTGFYNIDGHTTSTITSSDLAGQPTWSTTTGEAVIKLATWIIVKYKITGQAANQITFINTHETVDKMQDDWGFFIQNSHNTLTYDKAWYKTTADKLEYYSASGNAPTGIIQCANVSDLLTCNNFDNITIDGLAFTGANDTCINILDGSRINVKNCYFNGSMLAISTEAVNSNYSHDTIINALSNAIRIKQTSGSQGDNDTAWYNYIYNTSIITGTSGYINNNTDNDGGGITTKGNGTDVRYNEIRNVGLGGIWGYHRNNVIFKYNWVDSFNINRSDIGGIYFTANNSTSFNTGRKVIHNIVSNSLGTVSGTSNSESKCYAFYFDVGAYGIVCDSNTAVNAMGGYFVHKGANVTFRNNTSYNMTKNAIQINHESSSSGLPNTLFTVTKNILYGINSLQALLNVSPQVAAADIDNIGIIDSNYYIRPLDVKTIILDWKSPGGGTGATTKRALDFTVGTITSWKSNHSSVPYDVHSTTGPYSYSSSAHQTDSVLFYYNPTASNATKSFSGKYKDIFGTSYTNVAVLPPYSSMILFLITKTTAPPNPENRIHFLRKHPKP